MVQLLCLASATPHYCTVPHRCTVHIYY